MSYSYRGGAEGWGKKKNATPLDGSEGAGTSGNPDAEARTSWRDRPFSIPVLRWVNAASYVTNVVITYGVGVYGGAFGLSTNADVSAKYQTLITPAGWAFAVAWSVIFVSQAAWVVRQFFIKEDGSDAAAGDGLTASKSTAGKAVKAVAYRYLTLVICQGSWTICFAKEYIVASFVLMLCIWINLWTTVRNLDTITYDMQAPASSRIKDYALDILPFAFHFGWISAAFVVNMNVLMVSQAVPSSGLYGAAIGSVALIMVLAFVMIWRSGYLTAPLVLAWALLGIYGELGNPQAAVVESFDAGQIDTIRSVAVGIAVLLVLMVIAQAVLQYRVYKREKEEEAVHLGKVARGAPVYYRAPY